MKACCTLPVLSSNSQLPQSALHHPFCDRLVVNCLPTAANPFGCNRTALYLAQPDSSDEVGTSDGDEVRLCGTGRGRLAALLWGQWQLQRARCVHCGGSGPGLHSPSRPAPQTRQWHHHTMALAWWKRSYQSVPGFFILCGSSGEACSMRQAC